MSIRTDLVKMMVGRDVGQVFPKVDVAIGEPVLTVSGYRHPTEFEDIQFELRRGEILGFYGLIGAGRSEFMQSLIGITRPSAGAVKLDGKVLVIRSPAEAIEAGIVYVPEERGDRARSSACRSSRTSRCRLCTARRAPAS